MFVWKLEYIGRLGLPVFILFYSLGTQRSFHFSLDLTSSPTLLWFLQFCSHRLTLNNSYAFCQRNLKKFYIQVSLLSITLNNLSNSFHYRESIHIALINLKEHSQNNFYLINRISCWFANPWFSSAQRLTRPHNPFLPS